MFQDEQPGLIKTRFLLAGDVLIRMEIEPGVDQALDLVTVVRVDRVITTPTALAGVPSESLESARSALLALAEQAAADVGDEELLEGLMFRLSETVDSNIASPQGWQRLEQALRFAFNAGAQPADIARVVDAHFRSGGNADMPPTE